MILLYLGRRVAGPLCLAFMIAGAALAAPAAPAEVPAASGKASLPIGDDPSFPVDTEEHFENWIAAHRSEDANMLRLRWDRSRHLLDVKDIVRDREMRAFLATPRERFVMKKTMAHVYDSAFLDIGYGVTISGPHLVMHMTTALDVQPTDKVLEIGTGSGYQSAVLAALSNQVYTVEIIEPLGQRTRGVYDDLITDGYAPYKNIHTKTGDGYYGWEENAPFDKIIVTCGIDHIPPPLLKQLAVGGTMVIPIGPPGGQTVLAVHKVQDAQGNITITREDIYGGRKKVPFVPLTKEGAGNWAWGH